MMNETPAAISAFTSSIVIFSGISTSSDGSAETSTTGNGTFGRASGREERECGKRWR